MIIILGKILKIIFYGITTGTIAYYSFKLIKEDARDPYTNEKHARKKSEMLINRIVYQIPENNFIVFPLAHISLPIKVFCHSDISPESLHKIRDDRFTILLEFIDKNGNVLKTHTHQLKANVSSEQVDLKTVKTYYTNTTDIPTITQAINVNLKNIKPQSVRIKLISKDPILKRVWISLSQIQRSAKRNSLSEWYHLPFDQKMRLLKGSVYPLNELEKSEKVNLISNNYQQIGPYGIPGKDFHQTLLFEIVTDKDEVFPKTPYLGSYADMNRAVVIPLMNEKNHVKLNFTPVIEAQQESFGVNFTWYGQGPNSQIETSVNLPKNVLTFERNFGAGYLHVTTHQPSWITQEKSQHTLLSKPNRIK